MLQTQLAFTRARISQQWEAQILFIGNRKLTSVMLEKQHTTVKTTPYMRVAYSEEQLASDDDFPFSSRLSTSDTSLVVCSGVQVP